MGTTTTPSPPPAASPPPGTIVFIHPDLGIGGAERLVVDAAVGLQSRGHRVVIFTNHCDPKHCFDECRDGTLDVRVRGHTLIPPSLLSRLTILCAILRHMHLLLTICLLTSELSALHPRALIVDQLSAGLPLLRLLQPSVPVLFYCHFPDLLLARGRHALLKRLYRLPFDWLEEWTTGFAHAVAVNSEFTRRVVSSTWPGLGRRVATSVVYPCVDTRKGPSGSEKVDGARQHQDDDGAAATKLIVSINRFEQKKDIGLAIRAFALVPEAERRGVRLVIAGGYDARLAENVTYHTALQSLATSLSLTHHTLPSSSLPSSSPPLSSTTALIPPQTQVLFLLSIPDPLKAALLDAALLLVYTPSDEHFGIVPLEAMLSRVPVLAANNGGPLETVADPQTGWLRDPSQTEAWARVMRTALSMAPGDRAAMGLAGERRVRNLFSRDKMAASLEDMIGGAVPAARERDKGGRMAGPLLDAALGGVVFVAVVGVSALVAFWGVVHWGGGGRGHDLWVK